MYLQHFGLNRLPFQVTPDPRFYFDSAVHRRAMSTFAYGLSKGEGFVVVTGEVGAGKTTLVQFMLERLDLEQLAVAKVNTSQLAADTLLRHIAHEFGCSLSGSDKADALAALRDRLVALFDGGKLPLLIVDEVQALSPDALEELRMLSNIQAGNDPIVQILLVGQPQFRARLDDPDLMQLRQRVVASYHLSGLAPDEVAGYITHRLQLAGWDGRELFSPGAVEAVASASAGNPRQINRLCDRLLFHAYFKRARRVEAGDVSDVTAEMREEGLLTDAAPAPADAPADPEPSATARPGAAARETGLDQRRLAREVADLRARLTDHRARIDRLARTVAVPADDGGAPHGRP